MIRPGPALEDGAARQAAHRIRRLRCLPRIRPKHRSHPFTLGRLSNTRLKIPCLEYLLVKLRDFCGKQYTITFSYGQTWTEGVGIFIGAKVRTEQVCSIDGCAVPDRCPLGFRPGLCHHCPFVSYKVHAKKEQTLHFLLGLGRVFLSFRNKYPKKGANPAFSTEMNHRHQQTNTHLHLPKWVRRPASNLSSRAIRQNG